jgi:hypothetical protein
MLNVDHIGRREREIDTARKKVGKLSGQLEK